MRLYSGADGLASDDVSALVADSRGFLWIGSSAGLSRFDGTTFKTYARSDGLPHGVVNSLLEDRAGRIWIGTRAGLARIDQQQGGMSLIDLGPHTAGDIGPLLQSRDGSIWVVTDGELYLIPDDRAEPPALKVTLPSPDLPFRSTHIEALAEGTEGDLWIGTVSGLLRRLADGRILRIPVRPRDDGDRVYHVAVDGRGRVWITHWGLAHAPGIHFGIYVLAPHPGPAADLDVAGGLHRRARRILGAGPVPMPDKDGDVIYLTAASPIGDTRVLMVLPEEDGTWVATADGLLRLERDRTWRVDSLVGLGLPIQRVARDHRDNLWLGTAGLGLVRLDLGGPIAYGQTAAVPPGEIVALFEDATGALCVAGMEVSGHRWFGAITRGRLRRFRPHGTDAVRYWSWGWQQVFLRDRAGEFWVATGEGLLRYPAAASCTAIARTPAKAWYRRGDGLPTDDVFRLFEDSRGDLWISAGGTVRWRRSTESFEVLSVHADTPSAFAEDRAGNVWIGYYRGGVGRWDGETFDYFSTASGVPDGFIYSLFVDSVGRLWVGSDTHGLVRVDDPGARVPRFVRISSGGSSLDLPVYGVIEDQARQFYVATGRGLLRFDGELTLTRRYSLADGLPVHLMRSLYADLHGDLWFGTLRGLYRLTPKAAVSSTPSAAFIDRIVIGEAAQPLSYLGVPAAAGLRVPPGNRRVEISYGSASLASGTTPMYTVRLKNFDRDWSPPTSDRRVTYTDLDAGSYAFEVRAIAEGRTSDVAATVAFTVVAPFWRRSTVRAAGALILVALFYGGYHLRVSRLLALERVRARIATDLHDDLGARLSRISILSEVAARRVGSDAASAERLLADMGDTARSLLEVAADITWSVDPRHDQLGSLAARIRRFAADMLDGQNIQWTFDTDGDGAAIKLTLEHRRHILLLFQEAVNNVVRHAAARRVALSLRVAGNQLVAVIKDDGRGFEHANGSADSGQGNGLTNMARRAHELGGVLVVRSEPGEGTEVSLSTPLP
jgi:ligand-binding sensor domain-containing protein/signal transduction histidine kinase